MKKMMTLSVLLVCGFFQLLAQGDNITELFVCPPCLDGACDKQTYSEPGKCPH